MMNGTFQLTRIKGIPIRLHWSALVVIGFVAVSLTHGYLPGSTAALDGGTLWLLGLATALLFIGSILGHELAHAWIARRNNIPVSEITLFIFGGVARIERDPRTPGAEFRIAAAGPAGSMLLSLAFGATYFFTRDVSDAIAAPARWLAQINLVLALFNLLPGYPLDGGRMTRAIIWKLRDDQATATRWAVRGGRLCAFAIMAYGGYSMATGGFGGGFWLLMIGWFLMDAAALAGAQSTTQFALDDLTVADAIEPVAATVWSRTRVQELIDEQPALSQRTVLVADPGGPPLGFVTTHAIAQVPSERRPWTPLGQIMTPLRQSLSIDLAEPLVTALQRMHARGALLAPVVDHEGRIVGLLSPESVIAAMRARSERASVDRANRGPFGPGATRLPAPGGSR